MHLNIRSIIKNHNDLVHLLATIGHKFVVIECSETFIFHCVFMGDFNIDISKQHRISTDFSNTLFTSSFLPAINKYTRVTERSSSILDNIVTNIHDLGFKSGVIYSDITDHYPITYYMKLVNKEPQMPT